MAQRRSPTRTKSTRGKSPAAKTKAAKTKAAKTKSAPRKRVASKTKKPVAKKAAPKRAAPKKPTPKKGGQKVAKAKRPVAAKPAPRRAARAVQDRRPPGFGRPAKAGVETRAESGRPEASPEAYVFERDARQSADETFTPGDLVPGNVGEARPAPRRRGVTQSSETESVPATGASATARPATGSFEEEAAGQQRDSAAPSPNQDCGRPKTAGGKANE